MSWLCSVSDFTEKVWVIRDHPVVQEWHIVGKFWADLRLSKATLKRSTQTQCAMENTTIPSNTSEGIKYQPDTEPSKPNYELQ